MNPLTWIRDKLRRKRLKDFARLLIDDMPRLQNQTDAYIVGRYVVIAGRDYTDNEDLRPQHREWEPGMIPDRELSLHEIQDQAKRYANTCHIGVVYCSYRVKCGEWRQRKIYRRLRKENMTATEVVDENG